MNTQDKKTTFLPQGILMQAVGGIKVDIRVPLDQASAIDEKLCAIAEAADKVGVDLDFTGISVKTLDVAKSDGAKKGGGAKRGSSKATEEEEKKSPTTASKKTTTSKKV